MSASTSSAGRTWSSRASPPARWPAWASATTCWRRSTRLSSCCRAACPARPARSRCRGSATSPPRCSASPPPPAGPAGPRPARSAPTPTSSRPASASPPCWPRWSTGAAPARASTSTCPRPRPRCTCSRRPCSTPRSTARDFEARGNRDPTMAPHGVYPAAGDDRWIAIACTDDGAWRRLAAHLGLGDAEAAAWPLAERLARQDELDGAHRRVDRRPRRRRAPGGAAGHRRRRPPGAEQRRVPGRPPARPPGPLRHRRAPAARARWWSRGPASG